MPFLDLPGRRLFYEAGGAGAPAVLLLHGAGCSHADWEHQVAVLGERFRVVATDLRGHGASSVEDPATCTVERMADDVGELLIRLDLTSAVVVGHSFSTRVAMQAGFDHRDRVVGVVIVDGNNAWHGTDDDAERNIAGIMGDVESGFSRVRDVDMAGHLPTAVQQRIIDTMCSTPPPVLQAIGASGARWAREFDRVVGGLPVPLLAIQSTYVGDGAPRRCLQPGEMTTPYLDQLRAAKPGAHTVVLAGTGHFSMLEDPDAVNSAIGSFVASLPR